MPGLNFTQDPRRKLVATFHNDGGAAGLNASAWVLEASCLDDLRALVPLLTPGTFVCLNGPLFSRVHWSYRVPKPARRRRFTAAGLTAAQVRALAATVSGERGWFGGPTMQALLDAGLVVRATGEQVMVDGRWTDPFVPTIDAGRYLGLVA